MKIGSSQRKYYVEGKSSSEIEKIESYAVIRHGGRTVGGIISSHQCGKIKHQFREHASGMEEIRHKLQNHYESK